MLTNNVEEGSKICICLLCGLPGSGKTTLAALLEQNLRNGYDFQVYHYDEMIKQQSDLSLISWKQRRGDILKTCRQDTENCMTDNSNSSLSKVFIIDDNMHLQSMRYSYHQLARSANIGFCQIYLNTDLNLCKARIEERNRKMGQKEKIERHHIVTEETFNKMAASFEPPKPEKENWEENTLVLNADSEISEFFSQVDKLFNHALANPLQPVEVHEKAICGVDSFQHQADLLLRSTVKNQIESCSKEKRNQIARPLSEIKKILLEIFRLNSCCDILSCSIGAKLTNDAKSNLCEILALLHWPLNKWEPADICAQVVNECFAILSREIVDLS